jgi:hypothetical protein
VKTVRVIFLVIASTYQPTKIRAVRFADGESASGVKYSVKEFAKLRDFFTFREGDQFSVEADLVINGETRTLVGMRDLAAEHRAKQERRSPMLKMPYNAWLKRVTA